MTVTVEDFLQRITPRLWGTATLSVLIVLGFVIELVLGVSLKPEAEALVRVGGNFGPLVVEGEWWRLVSAVFLHAGPMHLLFNLGALWGGGRLAERVYGNATFVAIFFLSAVGASLTSLARHPLSVSVGASGAICGVFGAQLAFALLHRGVVPEEYLAAQRKSILGFIGYNVVIGFVVPGIDMAAHAGGFVAGTLAGSVLSRDLAKPAASIVQRVAVVAGLSVLLAIASRQALKLAGASIPRIPLEEAEMELPAAALDQLRCAAALAVPGMAEDLRLDCNSAIASMRLEDRVRLRSVRASALSASDDDDARRAVLDESEADCAKHLAGATASRTAMSFLECASVARKRGDLVTARARLDACLALEPRSLLCLGERAELHLEQRHLEEAAADYSKVIDIDGDSELAFRAWNERAWIRVQLGRFTEARADADRAIALAGLDSERVDSYGTRCFALEGLGDLEAAKKDCAFAVELHSKALAERGMLAFLEHRYTDARHDWEMAGSMPTEPTCKHHLEAWIAKLPAE